VVAAVSHPPDLSHSLYLRLVAGWGAEEALSVFLGYLLLSFCSWQVVQPDIWLSSLSELGFYDSPDAV
jgi:hypothetical protein